MNRLDLYSQTSGRDPVGRGLVRADVTWLHLCDISATDPVCEGRWLGVQRRSMHDGARCAPRPVGVAWLSAPSLTGVAARHCRPAPSPTVAPLCQWLFVRSFACALECSIGAAPALTCKRCCCCCSPVSASRSAHPWVLHPWRSRGRSFPVAALMRCHSDEISSHSFMYGTSDTISDPYGRSRWRFQKGRFRHVFWYDLLRVQAADFVCNTNSFHGEGRPFVGAGQNPGTRQKWP